jgi:hypothetical protein
MTGQPRLTLHTGDRPRMETEGPACYLTLCPRLDQVTLLCYLRRWALGILSHL